MPGQVVEIVITMNDLAPQETAGFQAFIEFDPVAMTFIGGNYEPDPFGLPILPIIASGNMIDLAAGIDTFNAQPPTDMDAPLARLSFIANEEFCTPNVVFRPHIPPTRLTDPVGDDIVPLELFDLTPPDCLGDIFPKGGDGTVNVLDLLELLARWGEIVPSIADIAPDGCDGVVNVLDLLKMLEVWGPCA